MNDVSAGPVAGAAGDALATGALPWVAIAVAALALLGASSLRIVAEHERVVVTRLGRVVRVLGPGLAFRLPGLDRVTTVSLRPAHLNLVVPATTHDGVPVRLQASAVCRIIDPSRSTDAAPDPLSATANVLESRLAREIAHTDLAALLPLREQFESRVPLEATRVTEAWGVEVLEIDVNDVDTRLTADLLRLLRLPAGGR